jgi:hypothetical protein
MAARRVSALLLLGAVLSGDCASLSNPVADGVPVRRLPEEVLGRKPTSSRSR